MHKRLLDRESVCLRQLGSGCAGEVRFGRFLANRRVPVKGLIEGVCAGIGSRAARRHVLAIQDSSELNFQSHAGRVRGLGTVDNGCDLWLFLHPVLAVDADDRACLGLAHLHLWQRHQDKAANYRDVPIEKKESHRWIDAAQCWFRYLGYELETYLMPLAREHGSATIQQIFEWYFEMGEVATPDEYRDGIKQRTAMVREWNVLLDDCPLILSPFFMQPTPGLPLTAAGQSGGRFQRTQTCEGPLLVGELSGPAAFKLVGDHAFIAHHPGIMPWAAHIEISGLHIHRATVIRHHMQMARLDVADVGLLA